MKVKKAEEIKMRLLRKKSVKNLRIKNLANNQKNLSIPHKRGAALSRAEKEVILYTYESFKSNYIQCVLFEYFTNALTLSKSLEFRHHNVKI